MTDYVFQKYDFQTGEFCVRLFCVLFLRIVSVASEPTGSAFSTVWQLFDGEDVA